MGREVAAKELATLFPLSEIRKRGSATAASAASNRAASVVEALSLDDEHPFEDNRQRPLNRRDERRRLAD
jgi:hypothetical protein